jgi:hypothetical protein
MQFQLSWQKMQSESGKIKYTKQAIGNQSKKISGLPVNCQFSPAFTIK